MTFVSSVNKFVKQADWLTDLDGPAVEGLKAAAKALDKGEASPALLGQYRLLHKQLLDGRNGKSESDDEPIY